jgi:hypothetical protein
MIVVRGQDCNRLKTQSRARKAACTTAKLQKDLAERILLLLLLLVQAAEAVGEAAAAAEAVRVVVVTVVVVAGAGVGCMNVCM